MTDALKYWVKTADIDGYRCDVAGFVPLDFWNNARKELDAIKPVFMLAEWESRDMHADAFDMTYAWTWYDVVRELTTGRKHDLGGLRNYYAWNESYYPHDIMRMTFVSNHDKNAWDGTEFEQFGPGLEAAIVLSCVGEGMPLIYNGQEAGNTKRLQFFEKDPIVWKAHPNGDLYKKLIELKKKNTALWNAHWGARMMDVTNSAPDAVFSFVRQNEQRQGLHGNQLLRPAADRDLQRHALPRQVHGISQRPSHGTRRVKQGDAETLGVEDLREVTGIRVLAAQRRHNLSPGRTDLRERNSGVRPLFDSESASADDNLGAPSFAQQRVGSEVFSPSAHFARRRFSTTIPVSPERSEATSCQVPPST